MKKIVIFFIFIIFIVGFIGIKYYNYKINYKTISKINSEYEQYFDKEIEGIELATLINKTIDKNKKNDVQASENGQFIQNDKNSIKIEIYVKDNETTYQMETIYKGGTENFVEYYGNIKFKCIKKEYHDKTKQIKYMLFEQV